MGWLLSQSGNMPAGVTKHRTPVTIVTLVTVGTVISNHLPF